MPHQGDYSENKMTRPKKYTKEELLERLIRLKDRLGRTPKKREAKNPSEETYRHYFGSWNNALKRAGLKPNQKRLGGSIPDEEIFTKIRTLSNNIGRPPFSKEIEEDKNLPGVSYLLKRFGSIKHLVQKAGLTPNTPFKYSKEYMISKLKELKRKKGYVSYLLVESIKDIPSSVTYNARFGSFNNALRKAGIPVNKTEDDPFNRRFWKAWQNHCESMAKAMYDNKWIRFQKSEFTDKHPDIFIVTKRKHIDAKISGYDDFQDQIDEYTKDFCKLEFWCIWPGIENISNPRVKYYYAEELAGIMKVLDRMDLAKKCYLFKNRIIPDCYQKEIVNYCEVR